jgi:hypothetical protein
MDESADGNHATTLGWDTMKAELDDCPDCGVAPGHLHAQDCDVEQCPNCGYQLISCSCEDEPPSDDRLPWTGTWPGVEECREFGLFEDDGTEDLNRLRTEAVWNRVNKRFVVPRLEY